jgi:hypothetical protein
MTFNTSLAIATCRKQGMSATQAMNLVFEGKLPEFAL